MKSEIILKNGYSFQFRKSSWRPDKEVVELFDPNGEYVKTSLFHVLPGLEYNEIISEAKLNYSLYGLPNDLSYKDILP